MPFEPRGISPEDRLNQQAAQFRQADAAASKLILSQLHERLRKADQSRDELEHYSRHELRRSGWAGAEYAQDACKRCELSLLIGDLQHAIASIERTDMPCCQLIHCSSK